MNDPLNVVHQHEDQKVQAMLRAQQKKDIASGNCVKAPDGYRIAEKEERVKCIAFAKRMDRAGQWAGKIEDKEYVLPCVDAEGKPSTEKVQGWDALVTFGHWWVKE